MDHNIELIPGQIYTFHGVLNGHEFTTVEGKVFTFTTYRIIRKVIEYKLCFVNVKVHPVLKCWMIFQYVEL